MSKLTKVIAIVLMMLAAALAALAWWLGSRPAPVPTTGSAPTQNASYPSAAAAHALKRGVPISAADVKLVTLPLMPPGAFRDTGSVIGEIPLVDIPEEAVITKNNLAQGLALNLAPGQRAVAVPVDEVIGVGNKIEAGDYVDVFVTLRRTDEVDKVQSRLVASRWQVLAYGAAVAGQMTSGANSSVTGQSRSSPGQPPVQARSAVLAAPVDQVNALLLASQNGKITLALRHPADDGVADPALFTTPPALLQRKTTLSPAQRDMLDSPENRAFSGIGMAGLTGSTTTPGRPTTVARPGNPTHVQATLEVIKGSRRENVAIQETPTR